MKKYLLQITIGPVQDFIASARKLRDLWFGSYLLSELSKTVARALYGPKTDLIFPHIEDQSELDKDSKLIVANKIVAEIETDDPAGAVEAAKKAWTEHREEVARKALEKIRKIKGININEALYEKQKMDAGEFFGTWVELKGDYQDAKNQSEKRLAGRKNLREFEAPQWNGAGIPKSSLDGLREAVTGDKQKEITGLIKQNERLDALACIKRFYPLTGKHRGKYFDDLTGIALLPWIEGMEKLGKTDLILDFIGCIEPSIKDERPVSGKTLKRVCNKYSEYFFMEEKKLKEHKALNAYRQMKTQFCEPPKYACILVGDGDHMGKALDQITSAGGHRTFTRHLGGFAEDVGDIIEMYGGSLIYSGGDDVMAYIPLHHLLECADDVRKSFAETMDRIFDDPDLKLSGDRPTFSAGIAVVHHKCPLDEALNTARRAESTAKDQGGRNALTIIQRKRSGSPVTVYDKWCTSSSGENDEGIVTRLNAMITLCKNGELPGTLPYQLRRAGIEAGDELAFTFSGNAGSSGKEGRLIPGNAASALVMGIFRKKEHGELLKDILLPQKSIKRLSDEIIVARQIAEAGQISEGQQSSGENHEI